MISFRCWYCNKAYRKPETQVGSTFNCSCAHALRVPRRNGGSCRVKTLTDRLVEAIVYGGAGAAFGFVLTAMLASQFLVVAPFGTRGWLRLLFVAGGALGGFLLGLFGGEAGINWIGRKIREREKP